MEKTNADRLSPRVRISVVCAAYNAGSHIEAMLKSVARQSVKIELIVVDDGSTDETAEICRRYALENPNIVCISTKNRGAGAARNTGVEHAGGDFVIFLDSDDLLAENAFDAEYLDFLQEQMFQNTDIVYAGKFQTDMAQRFPRVFVAPESLSEIKNFMPRIEFWSCIYRKRFLTEKKIRFFTYQEQDIETAFRFRAFSRAEKIVVAPERKRAFYVQRDNPKSNTHTFNYYKLYRVRALVYDALLSEYGATTGVCENATIAFLRRVRTDCVFGFIRHVFRYGRESERTGEEFFELSKIFSRGGSFHLREICALPSLREKVAFIAKTILIKCTLVGLCSKRFLFQFYSELRAIPTLTRCVVARIFSPEKTQLVCGWIFTRKGKVRANNWGDDINVSFFSESTGKRVLVLPGTRLARLVALKNFVLIGSVINSAPQRNSIVWGSGLINDKQGFRLPCVPAKILAVRGPLTREWVLAQGVDCPAVFGDPALLLPRFYTPKKLPRFRVGLIPHHADLESGNAIVKRFSTEEGVRLIRVQGYENWRDFIDEICASDFVISASLHGLIVAEAYGVPALWVEFSEHIPGWDFKFRDFYASIGKSDVKPVMVNKDMKLDDLIALRASWRAGTVNTDALLAACPLELKSVSTNTGSFRK